MKKSAHDRALGYLARRDHSELELRNKLKVYHTAEEIEAALEKVKQSPWWPQPEDLARRWVEQLSARGKGALYIQNSLRQKGLPVVDVDDSLEINTAIDMLTRKSLIENLQSTAHGDWEQQQEYKNKAIRLLKNRGFRDSVIRKVVYEELKKL